MKIVLTEKPSVAKDIANVLKVNNRHDGYFEGNGYIVTWAFGHLIQLSYPESYDEKYKKWRLQDLPILPETFIRELSKDKGAANQYKIIAKLLKNKETETVICATDAGREGELIFRFIYEMAQCQKPIQRLWISSQTDQAILEGFKSLKPGENYQSLYDSAISRTEADWLVGINATRAYTAKYSRGKGVLSVGRVQTPVLKMIVDRYYEHTQFKPETYYELFAQIGHANGDFTGKWFKGKEDRITDKNQAEALFAEIKKHPAGIISNVIKKERREQQPLLYDLTELQKDANKRFGFSADKTLKVMQSLYERHKVLTYPRTSSRYLSADLIPKLPHLIGNLDSLSEYQPFTKKLLSEPLTITNRIVDDKKVTDHHAIIPTDKKPQPDAFSSDEQRIFDLVIKRFLSVFFPICIKDQTDIITDFDNHTFKTTGIVVREAGWRAVYGQEDEDAATTDNSKKKKKKADDATEQKLPNVAINDVVSQKDLTLETKQTKAPPLYTEASILAAMETAGKNIEEEALREAMKECGLGTPATRAQILERLIEVEYIFREKKNLLPTDKGCRIIGWIQDKELLSPELTGQWEKKLLEMAKSQYSRKQYMTEINAFTKQIVENVANFSNSETVGSVTGKCPVCQNDVIERTRSYVCSQNKNDDSSCPFIIWKTIAGKDLTETEVRSLMETGNSGLIKGFTSKAGNPFDATLVLKEGKVTFEFSAPIIPVNAEPIGKCPLCEGNVIETARAYSCANWKTAGCKFAIWKTIAKKNIDLETAQKLLTEHETEKLHGFISKSGKPFECKLKLNNGRVEFVF